MEFHSGFASLRIETSDLFSNSVGLNPKMIPYIESKTKKKIIINQKISCKLYINLLVLHFDV